MKTVTLLHLVTQLTDGNLDRFASVAAAIDVGLSYDGDEIALYAGNQHERQILELIERDGVE